MFYYKNYEGRLTACRENTILLWPVDRPTGKVATSSLAGLANSIRLTMRRMRLPVRGVLRRQRCVPNDQHVFGILLLRRLREVKTARDDSLAVNDH